MTVYNTPLIRTLFSWFFRMVVRCGGWRLQGKPPPKGRFVAIAAPHSSWWDFMIMLAAAFKYRFNLRWLGKQSLFFWPYGWFFRWCGGIPVCRGKSNNIVMQSAQLLQKMRECCLIVAPEGSRSNSGKWRSGFYYIALEAKVAILLTYIDHKNKCAGPGDLFKPTGDYEHDIAHLRKFYQPYVANAKQVICFMQDKLHIKQEST